MKPSIEGNIELALLSQHVVTLLTTGLDLYNYNLTYLYALLCLRRLLEIEVV